MIPHAIAGPGRTQASQAAPAHAAADSGQKPGPVILTR